MNVVDAKCPVCYNPYRWLTGTKLTCGFQYGERNQEPKPWFFRDNKVRESRMIETNYNIEDFRDWYRTNSEQFAHRFDRCRAAYIAGFAAAESDAADKLLANEPQPGNELATSVWDEKDQETGEIDHSAVLLNAAEGLALKTGAAVEVCIQYADYAMSGICIEVEL